MFHPLEVYLPYFDIDSLSHLRATCRELHHQLDKTSVLSYLTLVYRLDKCDSFPKLLKCYEAACYVGDGDYVKNAVLNRDVRRVRYITTLHEIRYSSKLIVYAIHTSIPIAVLLLKNFTTSDYKDLIPVANEVYKTCNKELIDAFRSVEGSRHTYSSLSREATIAPVRSSRGVSYSTLMFITS